MGTSFGATELSADDLRGMRNGRGDGDGERAILFRFELVAIPSTVGGELKLDSYCVGVPSLIWKNQLLHNQVQLSFSHAEAEKKSRTRYTNFCNRRP